MNEKVISRVVELAKEIMPEAKCEVSLMNYSFLRDDNWDSVNRVSLITSLEDEFDVTFKLKELSSWETLEQLSDIIICKIDD
ncbi:acyl carrier protein [Marinifilum flexuosum]|uniref:acyl carrier protein n=1 Tax=Marinifilum flexuosum TaxID=1117708 RepID=UPI002493ADD6|nr:acyl carrier protein [Marinifilum flexuosum]